MNQLDWTHDADGITYQCCGQCSSKWYFRRGFCPRCGSSNPSTLLASGAGIVHARTLVTRAPTNEWRMHSPYLVVMVDAEEGFRLMAHGSTELQIGTRVRARFIVRAGRKIPYFEQVQ
jgi:uncharacterized OB-fold protein